MLGQRMLALGGEPRASSLAPRVSSLEPRASSLAPRGSRLPSRASSGLSRGRKVEGEGGWQSTKIFAILSGDEPGEWWRRHGRARAGHMGPPISARAREQEGSRGGQQRRAAEEGSRGGHQRRAPEEGGSRAAQAAGGSREGPVEARRGRSVEVEKSKARGEGGRRRFAPFTRPRRRWWVMDSHG